MSESSVIADLARWGPASSLDGNAVTLTDAESYCRQLATSHYENFPVVTWLLPRHLHQHFYNVYAYCRWADDLGDETGDSAKSLELLNWWQRELDRCYHGEAAHPVFIALKSTIQQFGIPQQPFSDLISAFVQDQHVRHYDTTAQLLDYCRRSADPVGRIVLYLCERFDEENAAYSDSICSGLQLANFWQDVSRDLDIGRVYLPREVREQYQYSDEDLLHRRTTPQFIEMMRSQVEQARTMLLGGKPLIRRLPGRIKLDIELFLRGGLMILDAIERIDYRVWDQRPTIRKSQFGVAAVKTLLRRPL
ncbi:squalene synthase HpnC [Planctomicrobium sp. SH661]|uniref:squalene synthase HpnC n=1 Tax=Planctomicrobium sp. SH661 TaxID=3448124 RepID=UPI003F5B99CE